MGFFRKIKLPRSHSCFQTIRYIRRDRRAHQARCNHADPHGIDLFVYFLKVQTSVGRIVSEGAKSANRLLASAEGSPANASRNWRVVRDSIKADRPKGAFRRAHPPEGL